MPAVVVDGFASRPRSHLVARNIDVADFIVGAVAVDGDRPIGGHRDARRAAVAHFRVDAPVGDLFPLRVVRAVAERHRSLVAILDRQAPIEPDEAKASVRPLEERRERMLSDRAVMMGEKRLRPRFAIIFRIGEPQV